MEWYEAAFDRFYPILYSHRDDDEASRALESYGGFFEGKSPILDLASGNGRHLDILVKQGRAAFGLDLSHYLLRLSVEERGLGGRVVQGDMRRLPIRSESVEGVLNMFTSFGYFSVDTDNLLVFREVHRILKSGGLFLFDFLNAEKIAANLLAKSQRETDSYEIHETRRIEAHGKYLVKRVTMINRKTGLKEEIEERLRLYTKADLMLMFESVDMKPLEVFGDYSGNAFVDGVSERVIIVSEKG